LRGIQQLQDYRLQHRDGSRNSMMAGNEFAIELLSILNWKVGVLKITETRFHLDLKTRH
jgi:hypothetical protein